MKKNTVSDIILNDTFFGITFNFASIDNIFSPKKNKVLKKNAVSQKKIPSARFWECSAYNIENQSPAGVFFNDSIFDDDNIFLVNFGKYRQCQNFPEKIPSMSILCVDVEKYRQCTSAVLFCGAGCTNSEYSKLFGSIGTFLTRWSHSLQDLLRQDTKEISYLQQCI